MQCSVSYSAWLVSHHRYLHAIGPDKRAHVPQGPARTVKYTVISEIEEIQIKFIKDTYHLITFPVHFTRNF